MKRKQFVVKRKQFLYWFSIVLEIFLIFFSGGNSSRADTASDVNSAISTGLTEIAQQGSQIDSRADTASDVNSAISTGLTEIAQKGSQIDAWDATCLVFGDNGITDLQAQYAYKSILKNNDFLSGGSQGLNGISDVSAVNGLVAIGKDPTNVNGKNLVADIVKDANNPASDYSIVNDLEALSTGSYGQASETARTSLTKKLIGMQDQKTGLWNGFDKVDYTARAILALSMNTNQPGAADALNTAVKAVSNHLYQENGGFAGGNTMFGAENAYDDVTMTNALASASVNVYVPLKGKTDYVAPVQRVLDQHPVSAGNSAMLIQQATWTFEQARFTRNGGKGSIFAFNQTDAAKPGEIVSIKAAAITKKQSIINDPQATASAKSDALNLVDQILATYVSKLSADSTSSAAIADRAAGVTAFNHVTVSHAAPATPVTPPTVTNNNVTVVNNPASSSSASSSSSATSTSSSSSVPISTPTVSGKPVKKASHRSIVYALTTHRSIVYALTTVKLYRSSNFTKSNLTKTYKKRARINRPMFLVISQQTNKQGHAIYRVKDINSGKTGYTLSGSKYFAHAYYSAKVTRIKVINPKGINEYGKVNLTSKKRHVKKNASLNVRKVVNYGRYNRMQLTNGRYITANKKFILATKIKKSSQNTRPSTPMATTTGTTTTTNNSPSATPTLPVAPTNPVTPSNDAKTITTTISIHADGATIASGSIKVNSGASALDALQAFAQQQGLALTYTGSGATAYVTGINGYNAGPAGTMTGWLYSVNGTEPGSSMGVYTLKDGDSISMTYNK